MSGNLQALTTKTVAAMTQLSEFTLRSWEKRHGVVVPRRLANGRRIYQRADIDKLRLLKMLVDSGHSIGDIAKMSTPELKKFHAMTLTDESRDITSVLTLVQLLKEFNLDKFARQLRTFQMKFSARFFLLEIVAPFLQKLGELVSAGTLDVFHEHAASSIIRNVLSGILYLSEQANETSNRNPVVLSTPEGDIHEFGVLICAILAQMAGFKVIYLGPNLPVGSMLKACKTLRDPLLVIGVSASEQSVSKDFLANYFDELQVGLKGKGSIWLGGPRVSDLQRLKSVRSLECFMSFAQFESALIKWK